MCLIFNIKCLLYEMLATILQTELDTNTSLLDCYTLRQIPRAIYIASPQHSDVVTEQLHWNYC